MPNAALDNLFLSPPPISPAGATFAPPADTGRDFDDELQRAGQPTPDPVSASGTVTSNDPFPWSPPSPSPSDRDRSDYSDSPDPGPRNTDNNWASSDHSPNDGGYGSNATAGPATQSAHDRSSGTTDRRDRQHRTDDRRDEFTQTSKSSPATAQPHSAKNQSHDGDQSHAAKSSTEPRAVATSADKDASSDPKAVKIATVDKRLANTPGSATADVKVESADPSLQKTDSATAEEAAAATADAKSDVAKNAVADAVTTAVKADAKSVAGDAAAKAKIAATATQNAQVNESSNSSAAEKTVDQPAHPTDNPQATAEAQAAITAQQTTAESSEASGRAATSAGKRKQNQSQSETGQQSQSLQTANIATINPGDSSTAVAITSVFPTTLDKPDETSVRAVDSSSSSISAAANKPAALTGDVQPSAANAAASNAPARLSSSGTQSQYAAPAERSTALQVDQIRFVQRVANAFRSIDPEGGQIRLRLSPPELGSLKVDISVRNGTMTARLETENNTARTLLLDNLPALRDRLAGQNIKIDRFDVDLKQDGTSNGSSNRPNDFSGSRQDTPRPQSNGRVPITSRSESNPATATVGSVNTSGSGQINVVV